MTGTCSTPDTKTAVPIGRTPFLGENPRPAKMFLDTGIEQVAGHASRARRWGWDGACLETVSAIAHDPIGYKGKDFNLYRYCKDDPATLVDPLGTKCRIATRCGPARLSGVPLGTHCGIVVEDDDGTIAIDGSGGNTNTFDIEDPPIPWGTTSAFTDFPDSTCACIKNKVKKWNDLKVPRDSLDANSNWALNCLTGKCGITIPWEKGKEPEGWYGKECVEWRSDMSGPWGPVYTCCKYKPKPCPDL